MTTADLRAAFQTAVAACEAHDASAPLATIQMRLGKRLTADEMHEHVAWRNERDRLHAAMIAAYDAIAMAANRAAFEDGFEG